MRRILTVFALAAFFALYGLDLYEERRVSKFVHAVYVDGQVKYDLDLDGLEKSKPKLEAYELAMLLNAPSGALVLPIELATWGTTTERFHDVNAFHKRILWQFGLFGILVWNAAGKFLDDTRTAFSKHPDVSLRWYDWMFSILCLGSGFVLSGLGIEESEIHVAYFYSGIAWMLLGAISITFRIFQWRSQKP